MRHSVFFFNDTATTEIYTLSLHDALPISAEARDAIDRLGHDHAADQKRHTQADDGDDGHGGVPQHVAQQRSEEHTSELQSLTNLVCRLLLEKKKNKNQSPREASTNYYVRS